MVIHTAGIHLEYDNVFASACRYERKIAVGGRRSAVFPVDPAVLAHALLGDEVLLLLRAQDGVNILPALVQHTARILLREVGSGAVVDRVLPTGVADVRLARIGEILRQPALVELVGHRDVHFAAVGKGDGHIADILLYAFTHRDIAPQIQ